MMMTVNGKVQAVVQDAVSFQQGRGQMALRRILALGRKQIEDGMVTDHDASCAELDADDAGIIGEA